MFIFFTIILVAIGLSMDSFSLSLGYGVFLNNKRKIINISLLVGLFHFIMPLIGSSLGIYLKKIIPMEDSKIIGIIFLIISLEIIYSVIKKEGVEPLNSTIDTIIFAFSVSLDSFSTGIGIKAFQTNKIVIAIIFFFISFIFTYFGLLFGKKLKERIGNKSQIVGLLILLLLSLKYILY